MRWKAQCNTRRSLGGNSWPHCRRRAEDIGPVVIALGRKKALF